MKIAVFGAGATGGHFAALLARAGAEVSVVVRGATLAAVRQAGLTLRTDHGELQASVQASDDARELGPQDLVLVTLKSHALADAADAMAPLLGVRTPVVFLQNGIPWWYHHAEGGLREGRRLPALDPRDRLWQAIGPERVIGGVTSSACTVVAPGVIEVRGGNRPLTLGEPSGQDTERLRTTAAVLRDAGFPVEATAAIRGAIWAKLAQNLASGPMGVLAPVPMKELFAEQVLIDARLRIQAEVTAIALAEGCSMSMDFGAQMAFVRQSSHVPSIAQDAAEGRRMELESMFLAPLRLAREHGVATPTLDLLVALATLKARALGLYP
ncbi:2-dehydropantoate 2-reductase [Hydrogenophaga sp.]|uniref:ketopantoate reductase family protein n=1 Tax=Hydrogenophaga sp. TaxID=1904254 RepID=UPI00261E07A2|nr:2-dehydropantoate 2-reductase [Hydrogenophaga sp.]MCW5654363.1 2-dehydropantoate 2-reductase [Hydrogenophaga sp.]